MNTNHVIFELLVTYYIADEIKRPRFQLSLLIMYTVWLFWSMFIQALLYSTLPALTAVRSAERLPFDSMDSLATSDFQVFGSPLTKETLLVHF